MGEIQALARVVVGSKVTCRQRTGATRQTVQRYEAKRKRELIESHQGRVAKAELSDLILGRRVMILARSRSGA